MRMRIVNGSYYWPLSVARFEFCETTTPNNSNFPKYFRQFRSLECRHPEFSSERMHTHTHAKLTRKSHTMMRMPQILVHFSRSRCSRCFCFAVVPTGECENEINRTMCVRIVFHRVELSRPSSDAAAPRLSSRRWRYVCVARWLCLCRSPNGERSYSNNRQIIILHHRINRKYVYVLRCCRWSPPVRSLRLQKRIETQRVYSSLSAGVLMRVKGVLALIGIRH